MSEKGRNLSVGATWQTGTMPKATQSGDQTAAGSSNTAAGKEAPVAQWRPRPSREKSDESEFGSGKLASQEREHLHYDLPDTSTRSNAARNLLATHRQGNGTSAFTVDPSRTVFARCAPSHKPGTGTSDLFWI